MLAKISALALLLSLSLGLPALAADEPLLLKNTWYYRVDEVHYANLPKTAKIRDMFGDVIAEVSNSFKKALAIEGSGKLLDERVVNFAGVVGKESRYFITDAEYGIGIGDCPLIPFRSAAVDPSVVPLGSTIEIQETIGLVLPDGPAHDGRWQAVDIGGAIKKNRIDLFVGSFANGKDIEASGITYLLPLHVTIVATPPADSCVTHQRDPYDKDGKPSTPPAPQTRL